MKLTVLVLAIALWFGCQNPVIQPFRPVELKNTDSLVYYINKVRTDSGLVALKTESSLVLLSEKKVLLMIEDRNISHDGLTIDDTYASSLAQIVGCNYNSDKGLFNAYMKSDNHRKFILMPKMTHIGTFTKDKYNCVHFAKF